MNWLDIVIVIIAGLFGVKGLFKGAIKAAFDLAGLIVGIFLAGRCYQALADVFSPGGSGWVAIAAYALILVATIVVASVIGLIVSKLIHVTMLGWLDRLIGFFLGVGMGSMLCVAALAIIIKYLPSIDVIIAQAEVARFLMERFPLLLALLPEEFDFIRDFFSPPRQSC